MRNKIFSIFILVILVTIVLIPVTGYAATEGVYPKLIVNDYTVQGDALTPGDTTSITINIHNTNRARSVRNLRLSFEDTTGDILPVKTSSHLCSYIGVNKIYQWEIEVFAVENAKDAPHTINIAMEYEDKRGNQLTAEDTIIIDVVQPVRMEYTEPEFPTRVTQGDTFSFPMTLMNMGKGDIYNALLTFDIEGIASGGSVLVGTLPQGESKEGKTNFRVDKEIEGKISGQILLSYEDSRGRYYETIFPVSTIIEPKVVEIYSSEEEESVNENSYPWKTIAICLGVLSLILLCLAIIMFAKGRKIRKEYEMKL